MNLREWATKIYIDSYRMGMNEIMEFQISKFIKLGKAHPIHVASLVPERVDLIENILKEIKDEFNHATIVIFNRLIDNIDNKEINNIKEIRQEIRNIVSQLKK